MRAGGLLCLALATTALAPSAARSQTYELAVEMGVGSGLQARTEDGYGPTARLPTFASLHLGYQWEGDTSIELGVDIAVPVERRAGLLIAPQIRLNRQVAEGWWIYGGVGPGADVLPEVRFGIDVGIGGRYQVVEFLAIYLELGSDLLFLGPGVGKRGLDLLLGASVGLRTQF